MALTCTGYVAVTEAGPALCQGPSFFTLSRALNYQILDITHYELQFPACDVQTCSNFNRPNHQNQARETFYPKPINNET